MDNNEEILQLRTPGQRLAMSIYNTVFGPIHRACRWLHARYTPGTAVFKE